MRISIPTIPKSLTSSLPSRAYTRTTAIERIASFLAPGNTAVLTGAGISVDSGIRAYRGKDGRYVNPNYKPILYHELVDETEKGVAFRQRYWLRSFLGYGSVRDASPNTSHYALAALQYPKVVTRLITQNVDGLHAKALSSIMNSDEIASSVLELHGTLHKVSCKKGHIVDRNVFQRRLAAANPRWVKFVDDLEASGRKLRTNPDGDIVIEGEPYESFVIPDCPSCLHENRKLNNHKPHLIFFGESITKEVKDRSYNDIEITDRLLIVGTTLATYSAFRLLKYAIGLGKPVLILNVGPTRADSLNCSIEKIEMSSGLVLHDAARLLTPSDDPVIARLLASGIDKPPLDDERDS